MNRCIQHETADEFLLNHVDAIVTKADKEGIPFAVFSHSTAMTHDYNGALKFVDGSLSRYLEVSSSHISLVLLEFQEF